WIHQRGKVHSQKNQKIPFGPLGDPQVLLLLVLHAPVMFHKVVLAPHLYRLVEPALNKIQVHFGEGCLLVACSLLIQILAV
ncbi:unnamed protein product, partial [Urochloa humidicola]